AGCLGDDEVPLALLHWTGTAGLIYVDRWAVRRRVTRLDEAPRWPLLTADRVLAEGEASFLQFQDQVDDLRAATSGASPPSPPAASRSSRSSSPSKRCACAARPATARRTGAPLGPRRSSTREAPMAQATTKTETISSQQYMYPINWADYYHGIYTTGGGAT